MAYELFMDGWDRGGPGRMWAAHSGASLVVNPTQGRRGTPCLEREYGPATNDWLRSVLFTPAAKCTLGLAIYLTGNEQSIELRLGHNWGRQIALKISDFGLYSIIDGAGTTLWNSLDLLQLNAWHHLELAVFCDAAGTFELRVNGKFKAFGDADTQAINGSLINSVYMGWDGVGSTGCYIDDLLFAYGDELRFFGDCRVDTLSLTANATPQEWLVNQAGAPEPDAFSVLNQDEGSIYAAAADKTSRFVVGDIAHLPYRVHGVQVVTRAGKTDAGTATMKLQVESGQTIDESESIALTTSKLTYWNGLTLNPDTNLPWNLASINAAKVGIRSEAL